MANILIILGIVFGVIIIGGGAGLLIYSKIKPKRETWPAVVYKPSKAKFEKFYDSKGKIIEGQTPLTRLIPAFVDLLIFDGQDYKLRDANVTIANVDADSLNDFRNIVPGRGGKFSRFVEVVMDQGAATILKSGYNVDMGMKIWFPMPYDRSAANAADFRAKSERYKEALSNWLKALPWVGAVLMVIAIIVLGITFSQAVVKVSDILGEKIDTLTEVIDKKTGVVSGVPLPAVPKTGFLDNLTGGG